MLKIYANHHRNAKLPVDRPRQSENASKSLSAGTAVKTIFTAAALLFSPVAATCSPTTGLLPGTPGVACRRERALLDAPATAPAPLPPEKVSQYLVPRHADPERYVALDAGRTIGNPAVLNQIRPFQHFDVQPAAPSEIRLQTSDFGSCLVVMDYNFNQGAHVTTWPCDGLDHQKWVVAENGAISPYGYADLCLDVYGSKTADNSAVGLYSCNGHANQLWSIGS